MTSTRALGANTWIWTSPLTDESLAELAPRIRGWGFDVIELPVENLGDWDPGRTATLLDSLGLSATIVVAMAPGRELVAHRPGDDHRDAGLPATCHRCRGDGLVTGDRRSDLHVGRQDVARR